MPPAKSWSSSDAAARAKSSRICSCVIRDGIGFTPDDVLLEGQDSWIAR
ncbi:MAG: hypothetical protein LBD67_07360 [Candidatus Accumulibacter sp.]|nr:hypothetical protein [Accumulibacter sp.]